MSKPAIVLVTGSFAPPGLYDNVVTDLRAKGYEVSNPQLETVGKKPGAATTMYDDAALIAGEAEKFADQGKDVVLIAHSYGGTPATESVKGLSKADREKAGKKGGIVRIGYMSTLVPVIGMSAAATMEGANSEMMIPDAVCRYYLFPWRLSITFRLRLATAILMITLIGSRMVGYIRRTSQRWHKSSSIISPQKRGKNGRRNSRSIRPLASRMS